MKSACTTDRPLTRAHHRAAIRARHRRAAISAAASAVVCGQQSPSCTLTTSNCRSKNSNRFHHRNQQYSVIALTDGSGAIAERYAYSAYGEPVFTNASGTVLSDSAKDNRYTYTGREWDEELSLYHFRARMYDAEGGRFVHRVTLDAENNYSFRLTSPPSLLLGDGLLSWFFGSDERVLKVCFRWQDWDYPYWDCIAEPERSKLKTEDYITRRDNAIETYKKSRQMLIDNMKKCCSKFDLLCDVKLEHDFKWAPIQLRPREDPRDGAKKIKPCDGGIRVLITTNHIFPPSNAGPRAGEAQEGVPYFWISSPSKDGQTFCHELGHCGGYTAPPGEKQKDSDRPGLDGPWHNNDPNNLMHSPAGSEIDQNWCRAIGSLARG